MESRVDHVNFAVFCSKLTRHIHREEFSLKKCRENVFFIFNSMNNCSTAIVIGATCLKWHHKRKKTKMTSRQLGKGFICISVIKIGGKTRKTD